MNALVATAWVISQVPCTLSSITVRKPFGVIASAGLRNWPPALLTRTSIRLVALEHAVDEGADRVLVADVELLVLEGAGEALGQRRGLRQRLRAPAAADHGGAEAAELQRRLAAEAGLPAPETTQTWPSSRPGLKIRERRAVLSTHRRGSLYTRLRPEVTCAAR